MPDSFGARMRQQRERQAVELCAIAEQTKIKQSLLEDLERDDVCHWPTGIFRRAYIRAYALAIGLDADVVLNEFRERHPDPTDVVEPPADSLFADRSSRTRPPTRFRYLVGSAMDSLARRRTGPAPQQRPPLAGNAPLASPAPMVAFTPAPPPQSPSPPAADFTPDPALEFEPAADSELTPAPAPDLTAPPASEFTPAAAPELTPAAVVESASPASSETDFQAVARLCTELGRAETGGDALPSLRQAAAILDAIGFIVWAWDRQANELRADLAYGYSPQVLAQLPRVKSDANNATAGAFRSGETCIVDGTDQDSDALVVPLMTAAGCVGVFAVELPHGSAKNPSAQALVTIIGAQLSRLVGTSRTATSRRFA